MAENSAGSSENATCDVVKLGARVVLRMNKVSRRQEAAPKSLRETG
jgi:hypothetical protein